MPLSDIFVLSFSFCRALKCSTFCAFAIMGKYFVFLFIGVVFTFSLFVWSRLCFCVPNIPPGSFSLQAS